MTRPLRILHVAEVFGSGVYEVIRTLANRHAAQGHTVTVAFGRRRPETPSDPRAWFDPRVGLYPIDWRRSSPGSHLSTAIRLRRIVRTFAPDVVHLHSSFAGLTGALALRGRVPLVYTPHAFASRFTSGKAAKRLFAAAERWIISRSDLVGVVSESEGAAAAELGATRVVIVPNGIAELDDPDRPVASRTHGGSVVAAGGRLVEQRRPVACARVLSAVGGEAELLWIGGGGGADAPEAAAALAAAGVRVTGWLPRESALELLGSASVYLHWTQWDGSPLTVLEAMALDVIVVASDIAPNREVLGADQVCSDEAGAIALIKRVLRDRRYANELRAVQRERRRSHSAKAMAYGWLNVYENVISGG